MSIQSAEPPEPFHTFSAGAFTAVSGEAILVGHVDSPRDLWEVKATAFSRVFSRLYAGTSVGALTAGLSSADSAKVVATIEAWLSKGIVSRSDQAPPSTERSPIFELTRHLDRYPDLTAVSPSFGPLYEEIKYDTLTSPALAYGLYGAVHHVAQHGVPGDVVECGVWRGGGAKLAAQVLLSVGDTGRHLWLYDTFDWIFDAPSEIDGLLSDSAADRERRNSLDEYIETQTAGREDEEIGEQAVRDRVARTGFPDSRLYTVKGYVQDTIPERTPDSIAVLRLDTDYYDSTLHELEHLYPKPSVGGILIIDDYGKMSGATQAVDEYFTRNGEPIFLARVDIQGRIAVKPPSMLS